MSIMGSLIFDRTEQDLTNETEKAYISYLDLNRIEEAVKYLSDLLNKYGYTNKTNNKTSWNMSELRTQAECERIKQNYQILKKSYAYKFDIPNFNWNTIEEVNNIEKILFEINELIKKMEAVFRLSNTFNSDGMEGLI